MSFDTTSNLHHEFFHSHNLTCFDWWFHQAWDSHWNWFTQTQASSHMFADGANEMFPAQGTYPFDQGHPSLGNYGA
jgi:hypothetical protein